MRSALFAVVAFIVAACQSVSTEISKFSELDHASRGNSFAFVPYDWQQGSLEYASYADSIAQRLQMLGFVRAPNVELADYAVFFDYGVGGSREVSGSVPIYGQTGGGMTTHSGTISTYSSGTSSFGNYSGSSYTSPTFGIIGAVPYRRTEHNRFFNISMIDLKKSQGGTLTGVFEGSAISSGTSSQFSAVSECIFTALLSDLYESGSKKITLRMSNCRNQ